MCPSGSFLFLLFSTFLISAIESSDERRGGPRCELGPIVLSQPTTTGGHIISPRYPSPYPQPTSCLWHLPSTPGHVIQLKVNDLELERGIVAYNPFNYLRCPFDYLYIFEVGAGGLRRSKWCLLCGSGNSFSGITRAPGYSLYVYFQSDSTRSYRGFNISYKYIKSDQETGGRRAGGSHAMMALHPPPSYDDAGDGNVTSLFDVEPRRAMRITTFAVTGILFCVVIVALTVRFFRHGDSESGTAIWLRQLTGGSLTGGVGGGGGRGDAEMVATLPTPPPSYDDIVKSEDDWKENLVTLDQAELAAIEQERDTNQVRVTYNLMEDLTPPPPGVASCPDLVTLLGLAQVIADDPSHDESGKYDYMEEEETEDHTGGLTDAQIQQIINFDAATTSRGTSSRGRRRRERSLSRNRHSARTRGRHPRNPHNHHNG